MFYAKALPFAFFYYICKIKRHKPATPRANMPLGL